METVNSSIPGNYTHKQTNKQIKKSSQRTPFPYFDVVTLQLCKQRLCKYIKTCSYDKGFKKQEGHSIHSEKMTHC